MTLVSLFAGAGGLLMTAVAVRAAIRSGSIREPGFLSALATIGLILIVSIIGLAQA